MALQMSIPDNSELGKKSEYNPYYNPDKLFPIARKIKRDEIGVPEKLPFVGEDVWNHYEVSWLNEKGKPVVALAEMRFNCASPNIIESKSMKLYFNSFNNTSFANAETVQATIKKDFEDRVGSFVTVKVVPVAQQPQEKIVPRFDGICLDDLDVPCSVYRVDPALLKIEADIVAETLCSDLLKSNCLITNQPDWGSVQISYQGKKINHAGLLQYIVSFRNHNEFNEQCIERIFMDIMRQCAPERLAVYGRYTRRGGLDTNPYRSTHPDHVPIQNARLCRQ